MLVLLIFVTPPNQRRAQTQTKVASWISLVPVLGVWCEGPGPPSSSSSSNVVVLVPVLVLDIWRRTSYQGAPLFNVVRHNAPRRTATAIVLAPLSIVECCGHCACALRIAHCEALCICI